MIEAIASFVETMFERPDGSIQNYGRYLIGFIAAVLAFFVARDRASNWRRMKDEHKAGMLRKPLSANIITTEEHGEVPYRATIEPAGSRYRVLVVRGEEPDSTVVVDQVISSLDEAELFLREETQFILADFS